MVAWYVGEPTGCHGLDDLRLVGVALDLRRSRMMHWRSMLRSNTSSPVVRLLHDLVTVERPVGVAGESASRVELGGDVVSRPSAPKTALSHIQLADAKGHAVGWLLAGAGAARGGDLQAPQHPARTRANSSQQLEESLAT